LPRQHLIPDVKMSHQIVNNLRQTKVMAFSDVGMVKTAHIHGAAQL